MAKILEKIWVFVCILQIGCVPQSIMAAENDRGEVQTKEIITNDTTKSTTDNASETFAQVTTTEEKESNTSKVAKEKVKVEQVIISSATKWVSSQKAKITLKKIKGAKGYQISIYRTKKNAKKHKNVLVKKLVKNAKSTVKSDKLKHKKTLYVRARAYKFIDGKQIFGKWSKVGQIDIMVKAIND